MFMVSALLLLCLCLQLNLALAQLTALQMRLDPKTLGLVRARARYLLNLRRRVIVAEHLDATKNNGPQNAALSQYHHTIKCV